MSDPEDDKMSDHPAGAAPHEQADMPATGDRGWKGLVASGDERVAFVGTVLLLALVALATVIWGLPGLLVSFLGLTLAVMVVLVIISMGS